MKLSRTTGGAEQLKGDKRDEAEELDGLRIGGGRGRLHFLSTTNETWNWAEPMMMKEIWCWVPIHPLELH